MKLPNANNANVEREKIVDYLLNPAHPDNGGKAEFFGTLVGRIESPGGKSPLVKTIWIVDSGLETARLVTAYPQNE